MSATKEDVEGFQKVNNKRKAPKIRPTQAMEKLNPIENQYPWKRRNTKLLEDLMNLYLKVDPPQAKVMPKRKAQEDLPKNIVLEEIPKEEEEIMET